MKILFVIAVFSFVALMWAVFAIMRHVRSNSAKAAAQPIADAEMLEAINVRLSEVARPSGHQQRNTTSPSPKQDASDFDRDEEPSILDRKP